MLASKEELCLNPQRMAMIKHISLQLNVLGVVLVKEGINW